MSPWVGVSVNRCPGDCNRRRSRVARPADPDRRHGSKRRLTAGAPVRRRR
ncbi:Hypothetical protein I596_1731 [Dokdonella koreensis DS-123]|uniref:Uncharacterized protein n=1 Tax=Dokdonella koreensis DS-123 TaxID=1300342 RepID=A0A160DTP8_9GAMM|nr:Hypothetical protein I596_1731 [Dokdonella koreensis DS-123]